MPVSGQHKYLFQTLKKRAEFLRVRGGGRATAPAFVLEGKMRPAQPSAPSEPQPKTDVQGVSRVQSVEGPRFGFTITKKIGNAVVRNRIRRRLRAALVELAPTCARPDMDYVIVARSAALDQDFAQLRIDLTRAFAQVRRSKST